MVSPEWAGARIALRRSRNCDEQKNLPSQQKASASPKLFLNRVSVTPLQLLTALGGAIGGVARGCLQNWMPDISQHGPYKHILGYLPHAIPPRPLAW
jgi:hypothetical protein